MTPNTLEIDKHDIQMNTETIDMATETSTFEPRLLSRRRFFAISAAALGATAVASVALFPTNIFAVTSAEKQAEADAMQKKINEWGIQLDQYSNDYYDALDAHDKAVRNMEEAQTRIDEAVARQAGIQEQLDTRARTMYKQGPLSFLDVIFGAHSFSEFTTSWDMLNNINNRDAELIKECELARRDAEAAKTEFSTQEQIAQQKLEEATEIQKEAQALMATYESELNNLNAEVAALLQAEKEAEEERQRQEAEAERQRQAAAAAAAAAASGGGSGSGGGGGYSDGYQYAPYNGEKFSSIVDAAMSRLGCPYVWGGNGPNSFDCSGLTSWCYRQVGIYIPRGGNAQYYDAPVKMPVSAAQPGDLLWHYNHIGICIGGGQFIHSPRPGYVVCIRNIAGYGWTGASRW